MYRLLARARAARPAPTTRSPTSSRAPSARACPSRALQEADDDGVGPADTSSDDDDDEVAEELATTALGWENM